MTGGKANRGVRMEHSWLREPSVSYSEHTCPGEPTFLTSAAKRLPPIPSYPTPEDAETGEVSRYRVVVEMALHNRLEPLASLTHGIVHTLADLLLNGAQLRPHAFAERLTPHRESP